MKINSNSEKTRMSKRKETIDGSFNMTVRELVEEIASRNPREAMVNINDELGIVYVHTDFAGFQRVAEAYHDSTNRLIGKRLGVAGGETDEQ